jgi:hypothetical protein
VAVDASLAAMAARPPHEQLTHLTEGFDAMRPDW